jgi:hypothetical protein
MKRWPLALAFASGVSGADPFRHLFDPWSDLRPPETSPSGRASKPLSRRDRWRLYEAWREAATRIRELEKSASACPVSDRETLGDVARRVSERADRFANECLSTEGANPCADDVFRLAEFDRALEDFESMAEACPPTPLDLRMHAKALKLRGGAVFELEQKGTRSLPAYGARASGLWSGAFAPSSALSGSLEARVSHMREKTIGITPYESTALLGWASPSGLSMSFGGNASRRDDSFESKTGTPVVQTFDKYGGRVELRAPKWAALRSRYGYAIDRSNDGVYSGTRHTFALGVLDRVRVEGAVFLAAAGALTPGHQSLRMALLSGTEKSGWYGEFGGEERRSAAGYAELHPSCEISYRSEPFFGAAWGTESLLGRPRVSGRLALSLRPEEDRWSTGGLAFRISAKFDAEWDRWRLDAAATSLANRHRGGPGPDVWEAGFQVELKPSWRFRPNLSAEGLLALRRSSIPMDDLDPRLWSDGYGSTKVVLGLGLFYVFER